MFLAMIWLCVIRHAHACAIPVYAGWKNEISGMNLTMQRNCSDGLLKCRFHEKPLKTLFRTSTLCNASAENTIKLSSPISSAMQNVNQPVYGYLICRL